LSPKQNQWLPLDLGHTHRQGPARPRGYLVAPRKTRDLGPSPAAIPDAWATPKSPDAVVSGARRIPELAWRRLGSWKKKSNSWVNRQLFKMSPVRGEGGKNFGPDLSSLPQRDYGFG